MRRGGASVVAIALVLALSGCGDDSGGGADGFESALNRLDDTAVVLAWSSFGPPQPDPSPSLRFELLADGTARAWDHDLDDYRELMLSTEDLQESLDAAWDAGEDLRSEYIDLDFADCGADDITFLKPNAETRTVRWECVEIDDALEDLVRELERDVLDGGVGDN